MFSVGEHVSVKLMVPSFPMVNYHISICDDQDRKARNLMCIDACLKGILNQYDHVQ
jgi:hypothetical protein